MAKTETIRAPIGSLQVKYLRAEITDSNFGFVDTGLSTNDYVILQGHTWLASNVSVMISNLESGGNYRIQLIQCTSNTVLKAGTYHVYLVIAPRNILPNS